MQGVQLFSFFSLKLLSKLLLKLLLKAVPKTQPAPCAMPKLIGRITHGLRVSASSVWGLLILTLIPELASANACFPAIDSKKPQYVIGYGSLLYDQSRKARQFQFDPEVPVWVSGFKRGWLTKTRSDNVKRTRLGVIPSAREKFNGVLIPVQSGRVKAIDRTQVLHCRVEVKRSQLAPMVDQSLPKEGQIWIYRTERKYEAPQPTESYPLMMSEVYEFLTGCIEQQGRFKLNGFAEECIDNTLSWPRHGYQWTDDSQRPVSAKLVQIKKAEVNRLLKKVEGDPFSKLRAE